MATSPFSNMNNIEDVTSEFTLGSTITKTYFFVYKCGRMIYGCFRGSTSANPSTTADPIIFSVPAKYKPIRGNYATPAARTWIVDENAAANYYNGNIVFAASMYKKDVGYAFSFSWLF